MDQTFYILNKALDELNITVVLTGNCRERVKSAALNCTREYKHKKLLSLAGRAN